MRPSRAKAISRAIAATSPGGLLLSVFTIAMTHAVSSVKQKVTTRIVGAVLRCRITTSIHSPVLPLGSLFSVACGAATGMDECSEPSGDVVEVRAGRGDPDHEFVDIVV